MVKVKVVGKTSNLSPKYALQLEQAVSNAKHHNATMGQCSWRYNAVEDPPCRRQQHGLTVVLICYTGEYMIGLDWIELYKRDNTNFLKIFSIMGMQKEFTSFVNTTIPSCKAIIILRNCKLCKKFHFFIKKNPSL